MHVTTWRICDCLSRSLCQSGRCYVKWGFPTFALFSIIFHTAYSHRPCFHLFRLYCSVYSHDPGCVFWHVTATTAQTSGHLRQTHHPKCQRSRCVKQENNRIVRAVNAHNRPMRHGVTSHRHSLIVPVQKPLYSTTGLYRSGCSATLIAVGIKLAMQKDSNVLMP